MKRDNLTKNLLNQQLLLQLNYATNDKHKINTQNQLKKVFAELLQDQPIRTWYQVRDLVK